MNKTQAEKLLQLADRVERVEPENFDMNHWKCQTLMCAGGYCCELFASEGFSWGIWFGGAAPVFESRLGLAALEIFFGLSIEETCRLFGATKSDSFKSPEQWAAIARDFVTTKQLDAGFLPAPGGSELCPSA